MTPEVKKRIEQIHQGIVPDGYTKTRSGITPTTWTPACLGNIYTERREPGNESLPLLTVSIHSGVSDGELDEDELPKKVKRIEDKSQYKRAATGDLVFNMMRAWQGAIGTVRTEGMVSPAYIVAKPNGKVYPPFMDYYMKAPRMVGMINRQSYGVTDFRKRLYWDSFAPIPCVLPPVREQKKIAKILSTQDKAIELQERKIDELKRFKKGCLEKLFPRKGQKVPEKRFPGFTDDWEQRKVGDFTNVLSASRVHKNEWKSTGVPFFRSSDVVSAFKGNDNERAFISMDLYEELCRSSGKLEQDDILITGGGSIGIPYIVPNNKPLYSKDADLIWIKKSSLHDSKYLFTYFTSPGFLEYICSISHVGTIAHYTIEQVKDTPVLFPALAEQRIIGSFFTNLDHLITLHQRKLEEMKRQKKALMQTLLTGIVRVKA